MLKFSMGLEGLEEVKKMLSPQRLRKALRQTLNDTLQDAKKEVVEEMKRVFDRPTPYTLNSVYTRLSPQELAGEIGFKEWGGKGTPASKYLSPQIFGGSRPFKRSERYLGSYYVPGAGAKLNQYGNLSGAQVTQILSALRALPEVGYMANVTARSRKRSKKIRNFFMVKNPGGNLRPGVYEKMSSGTIKPILIFIRSPQYSIRLRWFDVIKRAIEHNAQNRFNQAFSRALTIRL